MKKLTDFKANDWNLDKIKSMSYDDFRKMALGWSEGAKDNNGKARTKEVLAKDGATGKDKPVKVIVGQTILKPSETEIRSTYKKLTGKEVETPKKV